MYILNDFIFYIIIRIHGDYYKLMNEKKTAFSNYLDDFGYFHINENMNINNNKLSVDDTYVCYYYY